jgi:hypothetical protein
MAKCDTVTDVKFARIPLLLVAAALVLTACGGDATPAAVPTTPSATTVSPSATSTPTPQPLPTPTVTPVTVPEVTDISPLSGRPGGQGKRLLAVKIDNTPAAQPQAGLQDADVVWVQEVEGGLTRLLALFATDRPKEIGPVRSARISDISLLAPFGKVAFAYSGAQSKMMRLLDKAPMVLVAPEKGSPGWYQQTWRPVSYINLMASPRALLGWADGSARVPNTGWEFTDAAPAGGKKAREVYANWGGSSMAFRWDEQRRGYVVIANGAPTRTPGGGPQVASTVIVQKVRQTDSGFGDRYGGKTPLIKTVGSGQALVLRDGKMWPVTWTRDNHAAHTRFERSNGEVMTFAPGQVWIALFDGTPVLR